MLNNVFLMPKLGLTMTEGSIAEWTVAVGQNFLAGDTYVVVETDKVTSEITATHAGRLTRLLVQVGETVDVGAPIAEWDAIEDGSEAVSAVAPTVAPVNLTGDETLRRVPTVGQLNAARRLTEAKKTTPHFYLASEIEISNAQKIRAEWNQGAVPPLGKSHISITHLFVAALVRVLDTNPELNEVWNEESFLRLASVDIGIAVDTPTGLVVPVLRNAGGKSLNAIAREVSSLVQRARDGQLTSNDVGGGVMTVSNAGMYDVTLMASIIPLGQAAILGVGSERALFRPSASGEPVVRKEISVVLSCDHRVLDGVRGVRLLNGVREIIEDPKELFA